MPKSKALKVTAQKRIGRRPLMTGEDMLLVARLAKQGRSALAIARIVTTPERPIDAQTVAAWLRRARQPAEDLHMVLASLRPQAVENWGQAMARGARDGRHAPAKDLLIATGTIRSDQADRLVVIIGNGTADTQSLPAIPIRPALPAKPDEG